MLHRLTRTLVALVMAAGLLGATTAPASAAAGDDCYPSASYGYYHIGVRKFISQVSGASYFDYVKGNSNITSTLESCASIGAYTGGSWILPANIGTTDGKLYQAGWGINKAWGDNNPWFTRTTDNGTAVKISSARPVAGQTYRFTIRPYNGKVRFEIFNVTYGSPVWSYNSTYTWPTNADLAFWLAETWTSNDGHGGTSSGQVKVNYMGYSTNNTSSILYRTSLSAGCSGTSYDALWKNFGWDGSTAFSVGYSPCNGTQRGNILTTNWYADTMTVWHTN